MKWHSYRTLGVECVRCRALRSGQFLLNLLSSDGPSPCLDGGPFDQMLQLSHIASTKAGQTRRLLACYECYRKDNFPSVPPNPLP